MDADALSAIDIDEIADSRRSSNEDFNALVNNLFTQAAERAGLLDDQREIDPLVLEQRIYDVLKSKHVISIEPEDDDRRHPRSSSTKDELTAAVFNRGPTLADAQENDVVRAVYGRCQSTVWNRTQTGRRGAVQKRLDADKLVLIRGKVFRSGNLIPDGIYVSTHEEIVLREYWGPRLEKLRKLTDSLEADYAMIADRVPALDAPMRAAMEAAFVEATAKLPVPTLGSGQSNGRKAIDK